MLLGGPFWSVGAFIIHCANNGDARVDMILLSKVLPFIKLIISIHSSTLSGIPKVVSSLFIYLFNRILISKNRSLLLIAYYSQIMRSLINFQTTIFGISWILELFKNGQHERIDLYSCLVTSKKNINLLNLPTTEAFAVLSNSIDQKWNEFIGTVRLRLLSFPTLFIVHREMSPKNHPGYCVSR